MYRYRCFLALAATVAPSAAARAETPPRLLNLQEMVTADDYPATAAKNGQEGTVVVVVSVGRDGLAQSCRIKKSSGHVALDEQSCAVIRARARFEPARDDSGRAMSGSYERPITWRLEGVAPPTLPRQAWMNRGTLFLAENKIIDCKVESVGLSAPLPICPDERKQGVEPKDAIVSELVTEFQFVPVSFGKARVPPRLADATFVGHQVSEVTIDPDGIVSRCVGMLYSGEKSADGDFCGAISTHRFDPAAGGESTVGTVFVTGYIRKRTAK